MKKATITLEDWTLASIDQRFIWLENEVHMDSQSQRISDWALAFKDAGACISDDQILKVYRMQGLY